MDFKDCQDGEFHVRRKTHFQSCVVRTGVEAVRLQHLMMGNREDYERWQKGRDRLTKITYEECLSMSPHPEPDIANAPVGILHEGAEKPSRGDCDSDIHEKDRSISF